MTLGDHVAKRQAANAQRVSATGLVDNAPPPLATLWLTPPTSVQAGFIADLDTSALTRVNGARMQSTSKRQTSAIGAYEEFVAAAPGVVMFAPLTHAGDLATSWANERALMRFSVFVRESRWVRSSTVSAYTSSLKGLIEAAYKGPCLYGFGKSLTLLHLQMSREDGPGAERALGLPMRMQQLRELVAQPGYDRTTPLGVQRHAGRHSSLQGFLRPGELGVVDGQPFSPALHLVCGPPTIAWKSAAEAKQPTPVCVLMVLAIKDCAAKRKRMPTIVAAASPQAGKTAKGAKRGDPATGLAQENDPLCPYQAIRDWYLIRRNQLQAAGLDPSQHPLFPGPDDAVVTSTQVSHWVRDDVLSLGLNPDEFRGNAWRVGAATDLLEAPNTPGGPPITHETARAVIKQRGRWWSDIHQIYSRWSVATHALASRAIAAAGGVDIERFVPGFVQPGR